MILATSFPGPLSTKEAEKRDPGNEVVIFALECSRLPPLQSESKCDGN